MDMFQDKIVLITGGASGIGKIMTRLMLEHNAKPIIWDINQENIDKTIAEFANKGKVIGFNVDVSNIEQIKETAIKVKEQVGTVDILINNAGIVVGKYFNEHSFNDISKTMTINAMAPMYVSLEFINDMIEKNSGHICNIASSAGILSNPKMSVYAASKWSIIGWSDSLRLEMIQKNKKVNVTTIMPYYINTGMFNGVKSKISILDPEEVALTIVKAIRKNKKMLTIPGHIYRLIRISQGIMSISFFDWIVGKVFGIYKTMEYFTGHKK